MDAKRRETCNGRQSRENMERAPSAGKHGTDPKCGKTCMQAVPRAGKGASAKSRVVILPLILNETVFFANTSMNPQIKYLLVKLNFQYFILVF